MIFSTYHTGNIEGENKIEFVGFAGEGEWYGGRMKRAVKPQSSGGEMGKLWKFQLFLHIVHFMGYRHVFVSKLKILVVTTTTKV